MNLFPWTVFLPEGFENGIIQRCLTGDYIPWGSIFIFCRFSRKRKLFGNFDCDFRKSFTKGFFSDGIRRILKFPFWRQILDIYRQPLLKSKNEIIIRWSFNLTRSLFSGSCHCMLSCFVRETGIKSIFQTFSNFSFKMNRLNPELSFLK